LINKALKKHMTLPLDIIVLLILVPISLDVNVPYVLDQLDFHHCEKFYSSILQILIPGGLPHPLIIMNKVFTPLKLMIRSISIFAILFYLLLCFSSKQRHRLKLAICAVIIFFHVVIPQIMMIHCRISSQNHDIAHDGGTLQIEESIKKLLIGKNPYHEDFRDTPLENWRGFSNNVIYHLPYMPGSFVYSVPIFITIKNIFGVYDQRLFYLFLLIIASIGIALTFKDHSLKRAMILVLCLNPFFTRLYILGSNDIFPISMMSVAILCIQKKHRSIGFIFFALACAVKQFAWFFIPFSLLSIYKIDPLKWTSWWHQIRLSLKEWLPGVIIFGSTVIPFLIWDISSFFEDTFLYGSGGLDTSYPMQGFHGYGFATLLLFFRIVQNGDVNFPFIFIQLPVVIIFLLFIFSRLDKSPSMGTAVFLSSCMMGIFMFFSRYFHGNFLGFMLFWIVYGICLIIDEENGQCVEYVE